LAAREPQPHPSQFTTTFEFVSTNPITLRSDGRLSLAANAT
jgi:hypothetical protein